MKIKPIEQPAGDVAGRLDFRLTGSWSSGKETHSENGGMQNRLSRQTIGGAPKPPQDHHGAYKIGCQFCIVPFHKVMV
jgi:hypothetical protein